MHFFVDNDYSSYRQLLGKTVLIFLKGCHRIPELKVSCGGLENFFLKIGLEVQKPAGSSVGYAQLLREKLSYIYYKTDATSQKSNSWLISFIFFC